MLMAFLLAKNGFLAVQRSFTCQHGFAEVSQGQQRQWDLDKIADNSTANCFTLRKRIFGIKTDNSEVQSVNIHFSVLSSGSMAPCFSHNEITLPNNWLIVVIRWELKPIMCN